MVTSGPSYDFINFLTQYKQEQSIPFVNITVHGRNTSYEFLNTSDISQEFLFGVNYTKFNKLGGLHNNVKLYDPYYLNRNVILNKYNFSNYFNLANQKKYIKKKNSVVEVEDNFFIPLDDASTNELIFGSKSKYGHLIDIDSYSAKSGKSSIFKKYEMHNENKIIVNVDSITQSQTQRKNEGSDFGFFVINSPGSYISSLGIRGARIQLVRRDEIGGSVPELL